MPRQPTINMNPAPPAARGTSPRWHRVALWLGCPVVAVLGTVILLGIYSTPAMPQGGLDDRVTLEPDDSVTLEAEKAFFSDRFTIDTEHAGFTGMGYVNYVKEGFVEWTINVELGGEHTLGFRYALGTADDPDRPLDISVNGILVVPSLSFPNTGDWATWRIISIKVLLRAGTSTIRASTTGMSGPNIDHVVVTATKPFIFLTKGGDLTPREEPEFGEAGYENTYYGKVDPTGDRTTLEGWKRVNGFFDFPHLVDNAEYINAFDLGFGRNMFCLDNGRASCYVDNYLDPKGEGDGPRFAAAVTMERMNFLGRTIVAFFVFAPAGGPTPVRPADSQLVRTNQIQLDSEEPKSVPESCYACHKGYTSAGGNPVGGVYLPWDIDILESWPGKLTLASQADTFRRLNRIVWNDASIQYSRPIFANDLDPTSFLRNETKFRKESLKTLIEGWYNGPPSFGTSFNGNRLPSNDWYTDVNSAGDLVDRAGNPVNCAATPLPQECSRFFRERFLYNNVYARFCRSCHVAQGFNQDVNSLFHGLDWKTANTFANQAYEVVCEPTPERPVMPHAELTHKRFEEDVIFFTDGTSASAKQRLCAEPPPAAVNIADVIKGNCASCHSGLQEPNLSGNTNDAILAAIDGKMSTQGMLYVTRGNPDQSYLYRKIIGSHVLVGGVGTIMPPPPNDQLDESETNIVREWISGL